MDGYVRLNTDENGKIIDIWDEWYKDERTQDYILECGLEDYLKEYNFTPNSLLLVTFNLECETTYCFMDGVEYEDWLEIKNEIVLIEDYSFEDIEEKDEEEEQVFMDWRPND